MNIESAFRLQHAEDFLHNLSWMVAVVKDAMRIHVIKRLIGKGQVVNVG